MRASKNNTIEMLADMYRCVITTFFPPKWEKVSYVLLSGTCVSWVKNYLSTLNNFLSSYQEFFSQRITGSIVVFIFHAPVSNMMRNVMFQNFVAKSCTCPAYTRLRSVSLKLWLYTLPMLFEPISPPWLSVNTIAPIGKR